MRKFAPLVAGLALLVSSQPLSAAVCNVVNGVWTTRAPFQVTMVRAWGVYFPANGNFYAMGGRTSDAVGSNIQNPREYDPVANTWTTKAATFADGQVNNMVGGVLNVGGTDVIIVVGGSAATQTTATAEVRLYDPVLDTLTIQVSDAWPGANGGTTLPGGGAVFGNKLYVFGGFNINVGMVTTIWEYDPALAVGARWTLKSAVLPAPIGYIPTATAGNFIYLLGGSDFVGGLVVDTTSSLRYDPVGDAIITVATIPRATGETRAVGQTDGTVWVLGGGRVTPTNPSAEVDVYDPAGDRWDLAPPMLTARRNFPADVNPVDGTIWAVGGYDTTGVAITNNEEFSCVIFVDGFESGDTSDWSSTVP